MDLLIVLLDQLLNIVKELKDLEKQGIYNSRHLCRNHLDLACFAHDARDSDSKNLTKRAVSDKVLKQRAYEIARISNCNGYQSMVYNLFDKKTGSALL